MSDQFTLKPRWLSRPGSRHDVIDVAHGAPERSATLPTGPRAIHAPAGRDVLGRLDAPPSQANSDFFGSSWPEPGDRPAPPMAPADAHAMPDRRSPLNPSPLEVLRRATKPASHDPRPHRDISGKPFTPFTRVLAVARALIGRDGK
jgi:hypothetical protein